MANSGLNGLEQSQSKRPVSPNRSGATGSKVEESGSSTASSSTKQPSVNSTERPRIDTIMPDSPTVSPRAVSTLKSMIDDVVLDKPKASSLPKLKKGPKGSYPNKDQRKNICDKFSNFRALTSLANPDGATVFDLLYGGAWSPVTATDMKNWLIASNTRLQTLGTFRTLLVILNVVEKYEGEPVAALMKKLGSSLGQGSNADDLQRLQQELDALIKAEKQETMGMKKAEKRSDVRKCAESLRELVSIIRARSEAIEDRGKLRQTRKLEEFFLRIEAAVPSLDTHDDKVLGEVSEQEGQCELSQEGNSKLVLIEEPSRESPPEAKGRSLKGTSGSFSSTHSEMGAPGEEKDRAREKPETKESVKGKLIRGGSQKSMVPARKKNNEKRRSAVFSESPLAAPAKKVKKGPPETPRPNAGESEKNREDLFLSNSGSTTSPRSTKSELGSPVSPSSSSEAGKNLRGSGGPTLAGEAKKALQALEKEAKEAFVTAFDQGAYNTLLELAKRVKTGGRFNWHNIGDDERDAVQFAANKCAVEPEPCKSVPKVVLDFLRAADRDLRQRSKAQPSFRMRELPVLAPSATGPGNVDVAKEKTDQAANKNG